MAAFGLAIFTGAFLLFQIQPLMGKYLLPWFGGAPAVWTTCMLFFQLLLLAGYAYAHFSARLLTLRGQLLLHVALIVGAILSLPITPSETWSKGGSGDPTFHIIALLTTSLGLPYFTLSATAPLLQHWFSRTQPGISPFRLYALSNAGSLIALLSYPTLVETWLTRSAQAWIWGAGLVLYGVACAWVGCNVWRTRVAERDPATRGTEGARPTVEQKVWWILLPACASVLLLAVTNKICQDVAVIPFLWVLPLTLYLISFIVCFEKPRWYRRGPFSVALLVVLSAACFTLFSHSNLTPPIQITVYTSALFVCCMVCHGEVYRMRPSPAYLTSFYLLLALGGAIGGLFVGLAAPRIFNDYYELHWGLWTCPALFLCLCAREQRNGISRVWGWPTWLSASALLLLLSICLSIQAFHNRANLVYRSRNFYGVLAVLRHPNLPPETKVLELVHGRVAHGLEVTTPTESGSPTMYYTKESGVGRALSILTPGKRRLGVVGLGAGTLAPYGAAGDLMRFYEINPEVETIARKNFTFLNRSRGKVEVAIGDARRTLESEPPQEYDLLALDAFSSDAIPLHLLTREAFAQYQRHLKSNAIVAVHVSNQSLNLEPAVINLGREFGMHPVVIENRQKPGDSYTQTSTWVLLFRDRDMTNHLAIHLAARPAWPTTFDVPTWTDDFAALFPVLRWEQSFRLRQADPEPLVQRATELMETRQTAEAIKAYEKAMKTPSPSPGIMNNLAWLRATATEATLRNGKEAVRLAQTACGLTEFKETTFVGTLAAAYAEAGDFEEAIQAAEQAIRLATERGESQLLARNAELLDLYRQRATVAQKDSPRAAN